MEKGVCVHGDEKCIGILELVGFSYNTTLEDLLKLNTINLYTWSKILSPLISSLDCNIFQTY